jgi:hypothetical protein
MSEFYTISLQRTSENKANDLWKISLCCQTGRTLWEEDERLEIPGVDTWPFADPDCDQMYLQEMDYRLAGSQS